MRPLLPLVVVAGLAACGSPDTRPTLISGGTPASTIAETACVSAVEAETGQSGVTAVTSQPTAEGTTVALDVPGAAAPWTCNAGQDGQISGITDTGAGDAL